MTMALFDIEPLLPLLDGDTVVFTPNKRLRGQIHKAYAQAKSGQVVVAPKVFSLSEWLDAQWQCWLHLPKANDRETTNPETSISQQVESRGIANSLQRNHCWLQVLQQFDDVPQHRSALQKLVREADTAYSYLMQWQLPLMVLREYGDDTALQLFSWAQRFEQRLQKNQLISQEGAYKILAQAFADQSLDKINHIHLQSFDDLPPLFDNLLSNACEQLSGKPSSMAEFQFSFQHQAGTTTGAHESSENRTSLLRTEAPNSEQEILCAAHWCRLLLKNTPHARIGIVIPDLGSRRTLVERLFTQVFEQHSLYPHTPRYALPFNISTGTPLGNTPLIHDTFLLLQLNQQRLASADIYNILHSPFFSDEPAELTLRSAVIDSLRKFCQTTLRTAQLRSAVHVLSERLDDSSSNLSQRLQDFQVLRRSHPKQTSLQNWIQHFSEQLIALGWPGSRTLDSVEYQQVKQWHKLLDVAVSLDGLQTAFSFSEALEALMELAKTTHFQPEIKQSPIHILGTLEAAGLHFSHCWVMGLDNQSWPQRPQPNSLLPIQLQRHHHMPHASVERELQFAQSLTQHFQQCAEDIIFSHSTQHDESVLSASAFINDIPLTPMDSIIKLEDETLSLMDGSEYSEGIEPSSELQWVDCSHGPPLPSNDEIVKGGSRVLQLQAACPFNAFAELRLGATAIEQEQLGLSPIDRGNIIHQTLALVWRDLVDQTTLISLDPGQLEKLLLAAIDGAFSQQYSINDELGPRYLALEKQRTQRIVERWLDMEKHRAPFSVVSNEEEIIAEFNHSRYRLRIDRIDQLADGQRLLIDYKTGRCSTAQWLGERPQQPQLPLYLLTYPNKASGIAFGEINHQTTRLLGVVDNESESTDNGLKTPQKAFVGTSFENFAELLEFFNRQICQLDDEYKCGYAPVMFNNITDPWQRYAYLLPLNRFAEVENIQFLLTHRTGDS